MKKILFTTNHPAPYVDKWFSILEKNFNLDVVYHHRKSTNKYWRNFYGYSGSCFDEISIWTFLRKISKTDLVLLGGWNHLYCIIAIFYCFFTHRKCAVFSDFPIRKSKLSISYLFKRLFLTKMINYILGATYSTIDFYQSYYCMPKSKLLFFPYVYDLPSDI